MMIVAISGSNGFIGKQLASHFQKGGHEVKSIPRISAETPVAEVVNVLKGVDVVINLAGAPIVGRWTKEYKKSLFDSRIVTTRKIVEAISQLEVKPKAFLSASAIGIYAPKGEQIETSTSLSNDYLGKICEAWESEAQKATGFTRVAILRFGIVLGKNGGALSRMLPLFKFGLGGKIGSGKHGFSWIHIADLVAAVQFIITDQKATGDFNFTAPEVVDNIKFTKTLAVVVRKPALFPVPVFALKILFGEGSIAVAGGQFAPPMHLLEEGFQFKFPDLEGALRNIVG
jgi:uncharacterized protein (TIGR01777 family)